MVVVGIVSAAGTIGFFAQGQKIAQQQTAQAQQPAVAIAAPVNIVHRSLQDDGNGHARGWDPNNDTDTFIISDTDYTSSSVVVVNLNDTENAPICQVDESHVVSKVFEVICDDPPSNGAAINYAIINTNMTS
jgi:hypothetical protein